MAFEMLSQSPALVKDSVLALSAITDYEAFDTLMYVAALIGFVGILTAFATGKKVNGSVTTFVIAFMIFLLGVQAKVDMVVTNPVTAESYAISDVPAGLAIIGWGTSAVGKSLVDLYSIEMTPVGMGEVLARNGIGRGLAVITGMQGVPWSSVSRTAGNTGTNTTNIEQSINNYLRDCYNPMMSSNNASIDRWSMFHDGGDTSSLTAIWGRLKAPIVRTTRTYINSTDATGQVEMCWDAWDTINSAVTSAEFKAALEEDATDHYAKQLAAMSMPGASVTLASDTSTNLARTQIKAEANALLAALPTNMRERVLFLDRLNSALLSAYNATPGAQIESPEGRLASAWSDAKRQSDLAMAAEGDWWTRNAKAMTQYLELIVLGFLPILMFLMFATPNGMKAMTGIVFVYFWIQTWPIAYIILNHAALGSMISTFDQFMVNTDLLGMEDLYNLWDQARHSYAVSQSLLGMTPILTGAMLSGSMMMLTRLAGGMSSSENVDEKRIARDTESAAPLYQTQSSTAAFLDSNGSVMQNKDLTGMGTDISVSDTLNAQASEAQAEKETATATFNKNWNNTVGKTIQEISTKNLNDVLSRTTDFTEGVDSQAIASDSTVTSASTSWSEKNAVRLAGSLSGSARLGGSGKDSDFVKQLEANDEIAKAKLGKLVSGGVGLAGELGISNEMATTIVNEFRESQEFRQAMTTVLRSNESFNDQDTYSELEAVSESVNTQDVETLMQSQSEMQSKEKAYSDIKSRLGSTSSTRIIDEGRQNKIQDEIIREIEKNTSNLEGEEKKAAMISEAEQMGYSNQNARFLASTLQNELWTGAVPENAGIYKKAAGVMNVMRDKMDAQDFNKIMINNDGRTSGDQVNRANDRKDPTNNINTKDVPDSGEIQEAAKSLNKNLKAPDGKFSAQDQTRVDEITQDVGDHVKFLEDQAKIESAMVEKINNIDAKNDGEYSFMDMVRGGSESVSMFEHFLGLDATMDLASQARTLEVIDAAAESVKLAQQFNLNKEQQQNAVNKTMAHLLTDEDKQKYDNLSKDNLQDADEFLENKLGSAGIKYDVDSVMAFSNQIYASENYFKSDKDFIAPDTSYDVNELGVIERIGNVLTGRDSDQQQQVINALNKQLEDFTSDKTYGDDSFKDYKSNYLYDNVKQELQGKRQSDDEYITDVLLAELMAFIPNLEQEEAVKYENMLDEVKAESIEIQTGLYNAASQYIVSGNAQEGVSINRDRIVEIFNKHNGEGSYQEHQEQLSDQLREKINADEQEIIQGEIAKLKESMKL